MIQCRKTNVSGAGRFYLKIRALGLAVLMLPFYSPPSAQISEEDLRLPISLDADSTDYDGKSSMLMFKGPAAHAGGHRGTGGRGPGHET